MPSPFKSQLEYFQSSTATKLHYVALVITDLTAIFRLPLSHLKCTNSTDIRRVRK